MRLAKTYSVTADEDESSNKLPTALTSYLSVQIQFNILIHYSLLFPTTNLCNTLLLYYCLHFWSYRDCCFMIKIKPFINLLCFLRRAKEKKKQWSLLVCFSLTGCLLQLVISTDYRKIKCTWEETSAGIDKVPVKSPWQSGINYKTS